MDTSKTNIKMCDCEEIQSQWKPAEADFMFNTAVKKMAFIRMNRITDRRFKNHSIPYNEDRFIWLPRQDQLQEMYKEGRSLYSLCYDFMYFGVEKFSEQFTSMEQLWLAFVMKEIYNKIWNGKEWVKR